MIKRGISRFAAGALSIILLMTQTVGVYADEPEGAEQDVSRQEMSGQDMPEAYTVEDAEASETGISEEAETEADAVSFAEDMTDGYEGMVDEGALIYEPSDDEAERLSDTDTVNIRVSGTYYTKSAEDILDQINKIRKEACEQGLMFSDYYGGERKLTMDDYVPLKWSNNLEQSVRLRAMESSMIIGHSTLHGASGHVYDYIDRSQFYTYGENLAWNNNHDASGIPYGINQFYSEKSLYEKYYNDSSKYGEYGHYENMINPNYTHVGVAACQMPNTKNGWICIAMQLGGSRTGEVDETKITQTGKITNTLNSYVTNLKDLSLSGSSTLPIGGTSEYVISGKVYNEKFTIPAGINSDMSWKSSDEGVLTVKDGVVTGIDGGTAEVSVDLAGTTLKKNVAVTLALNDIKLSPSELNINRDKDPSGTIGVTYFPENTSDAKTVTWKSSDEKVIVIDKDGKYTAKKPGKAVITATAKSSDPDRPTISASCNVSVSAPLNGIALNKDQAVLNYTGNTPPSVQLSVIYSPADTDDDKTVQWKSENENIASVDVNGKVTAVAGGETVIKAMVGSFTAECVVKVNAPVRNLTVSNNEIYLMDSEKDTELTAELTPYFASDKSVIFSSEDPGVVLLSDGKGEAAQSVSVDAVNGRASVKVSRVKKQSGYTRITVCTPDKKFSRTVDVYTVFAEPEAERIEISRSYLTLYEGEEYSLRANILPEGAKGEPVFSSSDTGVASVDAAGKITASGSGEAEIKAALGELEARCLVTVKKTEVKPGDVPYGGTGKNGIWIADASFARNPVYTGKAVTQPDLRVYYKDTLLKEKTDYTLSYKNNTKVPKDGAKDSEKPQVKVTMKGQFQGNRTYFFNIEAVNIKENTDVYQIGTSASVYNGNVQKLVPELYYRGTKLKNGTDYSCIYEDGDDKYKMPGSYKVTLKGKGNFCGEFTTDIVITEAGKDLTKADVKVKPLDEKDKKIYYGKGISTTVKLAGSEVPEEYVTVSSNTGIVGNGFVTITPSVRGMENGYSGYKQVKITVCADRVMNKDNISVSGFKDEVVYDLRSIDQEGGMLQSGVSLFFGSEKLNEGTDYTVKYKNTSKAGSATMTFTGQGRYTGSFSRSYRIKENTALVPEYQTFVNYTKGGVTPDIKVKDSNGYYLNKKSDYNVTVLNRSNQKIGMMECRVSGKGNYKGYDSGVLRIEIKAGDLEKTAMNVSDKAYSTKKDAWKSGVKLTDSNGKNLTAGTDYEKKLIYSFKNMDPGGNSIPPAGTTVYVTAVGRGNYAGSRITGSYRIFSKNISTMSITVDPVIYTGRETEPGADKIHAYPSAKDARDKTNELVCGRDFYIAGYSDNIRSGNGKILLAGAGSYGGRRTVQYKINKGSY